MTDNSPPGPASGRAGNRLQQLRTTAARHEERWQHTAVGDVWSRLLEVEFVDRSIALAAKAFVSFFPFLIVVTALTPDSVRDEVLIDDSGRFGISGSAYGTLQQAFTSADETRPPPASSARWSPLRSRSRSPPHCSGCNCAPGAEG